MKTLAVLAASLFLQVQPLALSQDQIQRAAKSVETVYVVSDGGDLESSGTAFAVSKVYLLTANHICDYATRNGHMVALQRQTAFVELKIVRYNRAADICLLKGKHDLKPLNIRNADLEEGESIWIYGSPLGFARVVTEGYAGPITPTIHGLRRQLSILAFNGNSGSPVLDSSGQVVGVLVAGIPKYPTISFSPPHSAVKRIVR